MFKISGKNTKGAKCKTVQAVKLKFSTASNVVLMPGLVIHNTKNVEGSQLVNPLSVSDEFSLSAAIIPFLKRFG